MITCSVYLLFDGTCLQAMEFYKSIFGGELNMTTVGSSPMAGMFPPALHSRVVHARLVSSLVDIAASDWLASNETPVRGNLMCLYLSGGTIEELQSYFNLLSREGIVTDPLQKLPFGYYGAINDKFGVRWMFQTDEK